MRHAGFLAVAVSCCVLLLTMDSLAHAQDDLYGSIDVWKATTNGDNTTLFHFEIAYPGAQETYYCTSGLCFAFNVPAGTITVEEIFGARQRSKWALVSISCDTERGSTWSVEGSKLTIDLLPFDNAVCTFTNSPATPVGGVVTRVDTFAVLEPWLAVIGLLGCIGTVVVVARKRRACGD